MEVWSDVKYTINFKSIGVKSARYDSRGNIQPEPFFLFFLLNIILPFEII